MKEISHEQREIKHFVAINTTICDNCGKENCDHGEMMIGGSYIGGWYHLSRTPRSTGLSELQKQSSWDFCSEKCLNEFVGKIE